MLLLKALSPSTERSHHLGGCSIIRGHLYLQEYLAIGTLIDNSQTFTSTAQPAQPGQSGGLEEVQVQNSETAIRVESVTTYEGPSAIEFPEFIP